MAAEIRSLCSYCLEPEDLDVLVGSLTKKIELLEAYIHRMAHSEDETFHDVYYLPTDSVDPSAWRDFDNVYQVHNPVVLLGNSTRDVSLHFRIMPFDLLRVVSVQVLQGTTATPGF